MASESDSEKTEEPTGRRERRAWREGDLPLSSALTQTAGFSAVVLLAPTFAATVGEHQLAAFRRAASLTTDSSAAALAREAFEALALSVPIVAAAAGAALALGLLQTQGSFSPARLAPDLGRLDPVAGLGRLFQLDRSFQVLRSLLVVLVVSWLTWSVVRAHLGDIAATSGDARAALALGLELSRSLLGYALLAAIGLAIVDVVVVRRAWRKRLRMSKDEVKREYKESEGDPQLKQERRRAHQQMLNSASLNAIKNATVVIVNPTHFATALYYDEAETDAPQVVANGQGLLAKQIIDAARAYGVPVVRDVPLARALRELEVGDEIPEVLYEAVAEILRQVLQRQVEGE